MRKAFIVGSCFFLLLCMCAGMFAACSGGIGSSWLPQGAEEKGIASWQFNVVEHAVTRCILRTDDGTAYDYTPKGGLKEKTETVQAADTKLTAGQLPALAQAADAFLKENDSSGKKGYMLSLMEPRHAFSDLSETLAMGKAAVYSISLGKITVLEAQEYSGSRAYGAVIPVMTDDPDFGNSTASREWIILIDD